MADATAHGGDATASASRADSTGTGAAAAAGAGADASSSDHHSDELAGLVGLASARSLEDKAWKAVFSGVSADASLAHSEHTAQEWADAVSGTDLDGLPSDTAVAGCRARAECFTWCLRKSGAARALLVELVLGDLSERTAGEMLAICRGFDPSFTRESVPSGSLLVLIAGDAAARAMLESFHFGSELRAALGLPASEPRVRTFRANGALSEEALATRAAIAPNVDDLVAAAWNCESILMHGPRQSGKTTRMWATMRALKARGATCVAVTLSGSIACASDFWDEVMNELRRSTGAAASMAASMPSPPATGMEAVLDVGAALGDGRRLVLLVDEFDSFAQFDDRGSEVLSCLKALEGRLGVLCFGAYDGLLLNTAHGSPFNSAARRLAPTFDEGGVREVLNVWARSDQRVTVVDGEVAASIWEATRGHYGLVSCAGRALVDHLAVIKENAGAAGGAALPVDVNLAFWRDPRVQAAFVRNVQGTSMFARIVERLQQIFGDGFTPTINPQSFLHTILALYTDGASGMGVFGVDIGKLDSPLDRIASALLDIGVLVSSDDTGCSIGMGGSVLRTVVVQCRPVRELAGAFVEERPDMLLPRSVEHLLSEACKALMPLASATAFVSTKDDLSRSKPFPVAPNEPVYHMSMYATLVRWLGATNVHCEQDGVAAKKGHKWMDLAVHVNDKWHVVELMCSSKLGIVGDHMETAATKYRPALVTLYKEANVGETWVVDFYARAPKLTHMNVKHAGVNLLVCVHSYDKGSELKVATLHVDGTQTYAAPKKTAGASEHK